MSELRTLLERFVNGKSMDTIFDAAHTLIDTNKDEELKAWFKTSIRTCARYAHPCIIYTLLSAHKLTTCYCRSSSKQATSSNPIAIAVATTSAIPAVDSTTGNINPNSTASSNPSGTDSKPWARAPRINDSGRIGRG